MQLLFELTQDIGNSLSLDETLSVVSMRLKKMVPYNAIAVYVSRDKVLIPHYVNGENYRFFSSLEIPMGAGHFRLGGGESQERDERQPFGGGRISERSDQVQHAAVGAWPYRSKASMA